MPYAVRNPRELGSLVWPVSISLAATLEIEFSFFSCCYLDVSVHSVSPPYAMYSHMDTWAILRQVSPFGYLRIKGYLRLPEAFRSLSRPSSAPSAKAFPLCSLLLDHLVVYLSINLFFELITAYTSYTLLNSECSSDTTWFLSPKIFISIILSFLDLIDFYFLFI